MAGEIVSSEELLAYVREVSLRDDPVLRELREVTATLPAGPAMQVMAEEGQLLALLVSLTGARDLLEIGTFTGYSTLCMARALPHDGHLVTCDITDKWPMIAAEYWQRSGVADRIDVRIGPALDTIAHLLDQRGQNSIDFVFIDADKANYVAYFEASLQLVKPGGLIVIDNTLFFGRVIDPSCQDPDTAAIRRLNTLLRDDDRIEVSLLSMADGITLARKKPGGGQGRPA
jgi:O-methyltransferase